MEIRRKRLLVPAAIVLIILMVATVLFLWDAVPAFHFRTSSSAVVTTQKQPCRKPTTTKAETTTEMPESSNDTLTMQRRLFTYLEYPEACCRKLNMFGGIYYAHQAVDGDKFVCLDEEFAPPPGSCLVYSFGINNEWSFDKAITEYGCEVFAFDPSMKNYNKHVTEFGAHFYQIGLGGKSEYDENRNWKMMTLSDIRAMLGHTGRTIHYLKADIEGGEWNWLQLEQNALDNVTQLGLEVHMDARKFHSANEMKFYYEIFRRIHQQGFRMIHTNANRVHGRKHVLDGVPAKVSHLYELVWVKMR